MASGPGLVVCVCVSQGLVVINLYAHATPLSARRAERCAQRFTQHEAGRPARVRRAGPGPSPARRARVCCGSALIRASTHVRRACSLSLSLSLSLCLCLCLSSAPCIASRPRCPARAFRRRAPLAREKGSGRAPRPLARKFAPDKARAARSARALSGANFRRGGKRAVEGAGGSGGQAFTIMQQGMKDNGWRRGGNMGGRRLRDKTDALRGGGGSDEVVTVRLRARHNHFADPRKRMGSRRCATKWRGQRLQEIVRCKSSWV